MAKWWSSFKEAHPEVASLPEFKRARHSVHLRLPNDQFLGLFSPVSVFYEKQPGQWDEIDTELVDEGDYYAGKGTPARIHKASRRVESIGGTYTQASSRVGRYNPGTETFTQLWTLPTGSIQGDSFVSSGPNYEHRIRITADHVIETLRIDSNPGGMGGQPGDYVVIETVLDGLTLTDGEVGEFSNDGKTYPLPVFTEANGIEHPAKRFAKNIGGIQYLYTGILIADLGSFAYPIVLDPDYTDNPSTDGRIGGQSTDYGTASSTATNNNDSNVSMECGQWLNAGTYNVYRDFLKFDTSTIGASATISAVKMTLTATNTGGVGSYDIQIKDYDWSANDPVGTGNRTTVFNGIKAASVDAVWQTRGSWSANTPADSAAMSTSWINKTGSTYYGLCSSFDTSSTAPTATEFTYIKSSETTDGDSHKPILTVTYSTEDASGTTKAPNTVTTSAATSPYDDYDWSNPSNVGASDDSDAVCPAGGLATIEYVGKGTWTSSTGVPTAPSWPTGHQSGDLGILVVETANQPISTPSTWTQLESVGQGTPAAIGGVSCQVFYKWATSDSETAPAVPDSGNHTCCQVFAFRNVDPTTPFDITTITGTATTQNLTTTGITTVTNGAMVVTACATDRDSASTSSFTSWTNASLDSITEAHDQTTNAGVGGGFGVAYGIDSTAGSVNGTGINQAAAEETAWITFALRPAALSLVSNQYSYLLKAQNFGWAIPTGVTIEGVKVSVERAGAGTIKDATVQLLGADGSPTGNDKADTSTSWPGTDTNKDYGGATDKWGATLTPAVINDADFGVQIAVKSEASGGQANIDYVSMTVYYSNAVDVAITGQSATFASGSLGPVLSKAISGQAATFARGNLTPALSKGITGQAATFARGSLSPSLSVQPVGQQANTAAGALSPVLSKGITGQQATFAAGTLTPASAVLVAMDGEQADFASGSLGPSLSVGSVGQQADFTQGQLLPALSELVSGQSATFAHGILTPVISVPMVGSQALFSAGTLTPDTGATPVEVSITGSSATFSRGSLTPALSETLTGQSATFSRGSLQPVRSKAITGQSATFAHGQLVPARSETFEGHTIFMLHGSLTPSLTVTPSGQQINSAYGVLSPVLSKGISGQSISISAGALLPTISPSLIGVSATFLSGSLSPLRSAALSGQQANFSAGLLYVSGTLIGQQADFSAGQLTPALSVEMVGEQVNFHKGNLGIPGGDMGVYARLKAKIAGLMSVTADISASPQGYSGIEIPFDASGSVGAPGASLTYLWDFGDGSYGTGVTINHTYADPGAYIVKLRVQDALGARDIKTFPVTITSGSPVANAGGPYNGDEGVSVSFSGSASTTPEGTTITLYEWDFGDLTSDTGENVEHTYLAPGTYDVTLTVTNSIGKTDQIATQAIIANTNVAPTAEANGPYTSAPGVAIQFSSAGSNDSDGTIISHHWDFDDGNFSNLANPSHVYAAAGNYTVTLTVTDDDGAIGQDTASVSIEEAQLVFDALGPDGSNVMKGVVIGTGTLTDARSGNMEAFNDLGHAVTFSGATPAWKGGRVELDPGQLIATLTVSSSTPSPLGTFYCIVGAGNTWRCEYDEPSIGRHFSQPLPTTVSYTYRPSTGATVKIYAPSTLTGLQFQNGQFQGSLPNHANHPSLNNLNCAVNQLTGNIPALGPNVWTQYKCHYNQLTGNIPTLAGQTSLTAFYCSYNTGINGVEAGWAWPTGRSFDFQAISCSLPQAAVDAILVAANTALSSGATANINLSGGANAAPSVATGQPAITSLRAKGCTVTVTGGF